MNTNLVAAAEVSVAGAIVGASMGIVGAPVLAASVFTFTLDPDIDTTDCVAIATCMGATAGIAAPAAVVTDNTIAVSTFSMADAITPADRAFQLLLFRRGPRIGYKGSRGLLHAAVRVDLEPVPGNYFAKSLRVTGTGAVVVASIFDITLSEAIDSRDAAVAVTLTGSTAGVANIFSMTDTLLRIATFTEDGVASDRAFNMEVWRKGIDAV